MSLPSSPVLDLDVRHRRVECALLNAALIAVVCVPWCVGLTSLHAMALATVLAAMLGGVRLLSARRRIVRVLWLPDGRWRLHDAEGRQTEVILRADARVGAHAVWLSWTGARRTAMLLTRYDLDAVQLRRLVVRLRLEGHRAADSCPTPLLTKES